MRTVIVFMAVLLAAVVAGCNEEQCRPTAWILGGTDYDNPENEITGRLGLRTAEGIEFGASSSWVGVHGLNQSYGAYILTEFGETAAGTPYIGYAASVANDHEDGGMYGPIAGTIITVGGIDTIVEYQYRDFQGNIAEIYDNNNDRHKATAGLRLGF